MCELCDRIEAANLPDPDDLWQAECQARGLAADLLPSDVTMMLDLVQDMIIRSVIHRWAPDPIAIQYMSAGFATWSRTLALHADVAFELARDRMIAGLDDGQED